MALRFRSPGFTIRMDPLDYLLCPPRFEDDRPAAEWRMKMFLEEATRRLRVPFEMMHLELQLQTHGAAIYAHGTGGTVKMYCHMYLPRGEAAQIATAIALDMLFRAIGRWAGNRT